MKRIVFRVLLASLTLVGCASSGNSNTFTKPGEADQTVVSSTDAPTVQKTTAPVSGLRFDDAAMAWRERTALFDRNSDGLWLESPFTSGRGIYSAMTLKLFLGADYEGEYGTEVLVLSWNGVSWEPIRQIPCKGNVVHHGLSLELPSIEFAETPVFAIVDCGLGNGISPDEFEWDEQAESVLLQVIDGKVRELFSGEEDENNWVHGEFEITESVIKLTNCVETIDGYYTEEATGMEIFGGLICVRRRGEALTVQSDGSIDRSTIDEIIER